MGLENDLEVKNWVKIWYENFLFQFIKNNDDGKENEKIEIAKNKINNENILRDGKYNSLFKDYINSTIKLAEKYNFEINFDVFNNVDQGNINLFVQRNLGFGGTISGAPSSPPFIEWYLEFQKKKNKIKIKYFNLFLLKD